MISYVAYDAIGSEIKRGQCTDEVFEYLKTVYSAVIEASPSRETYLNAAQEIVEVPEPPTEHHEWDALTKTWLPNVNAALAARKAVLERVRLSHSTAPITYDSAPFDADALARERISGTLARLQRGDGLPEGWVGWRDYDNAMHWATDMPATVQTHLAGLSAAIENREQALLIAAWQHKATLDALTTVEAILAHDLTTGWSV